MEKQMYLCNECEYVFDNNEVNVDLISEITCPSCDSTDIESLEIAYRCDECGEIYADLPKYGDGLCNSCRGSYDYTEIWVDGNDKVWYEEF